MTSGNYLVDAHENDSSFHRSKTCNRCEGSGRVSWQDIRDGMQLMSEEIAFRIWKADKNGFPIKTYRQMLQIGRNIRKNGCDCPQCDGSGVL